MNRRPPAYKSCRRSPTQSKRRPRPPRPIHCSRHQRSRVTEGRKQQLRSIGRNRNGMEFDDDHRTERVRPLSRWPRRRPRQAAPLAGPAYWRADGTLRAPIIHSSPPVPPNRPLTAPGDRSGLGSSNDSSGQGLPRPPGDRPSARAAEALRAAPAHSLRLGHSLPLSRAGRTRKETTSDTIHPQTLTIGQSGMDPVPVKVHACAQRLVCSLIFPA